MACYDVDPYDPNEWGPYRPSGQIKWRHTHLVNEVTKLYEAQSYLIWRFNEYFNTHISITLRDLGIEDHRELSKLMPLFNKEIKRWLSLGNKEPRYRWSRHLRSKPSQRHHWIYVLEHGYRYGLHAHQLCVVPQPSWNSFDQIVRDWWWKKSGLDMPDSAVFIRHNPAHTDEARFKGHVEWFRYIIKSMLRDATMVGADGLPWEIGKIFRPKPYWPTMQTYAPQIYGICHALGPKARREPVCIGDSRAYFHSLLARRDYVDVYCGWEIGALEAWQDTARLLSTMPV